MAKGSLLKSTAMPFMHSTKILNSKILKNFLGKYLIFLVEIEGNMEAPINCSSNEKYTLIIITNIH